jgi:hypothetical protein
MWLALTLWSFIAFLASMLTLTRRGFAPDGSPRRASAVLVLAAALSALVWAFSLSKVAPPYSFQNLKRYEAPHFPISPQKT